MSSKDFSNFVLDFIKKHKDNTDILNTWTSENTQKSLEKILKSTRNKKDPNKPKRGRSSYILFCDDYRPIVKEKFPNLSNKEKTSKLAELWREFKETNSSKLNEYEQESLKERQIYKEKMETYEDNNVKSKKEAKSKPKDKKEEDKPKEEDKSKDKKEEDKSKDKKEEDKSKEKKEEDKSKEKKEEDKYKKEKKEEDKYKKEKKEEKIFDKRFENYYNKKLGKTKKTHPDLNHQEIDTKISKKWKKLSEEEKNEFK